MSELKKTEAYEAAKAVRKGWKLWCMWSETEPFRVDKYDLGEKPKGFVVNDSEGMRRMGMDLLRMADALDEQNRIWEQGYV